MESLSNELADLLDRFLAGEEKQHTAVLPGSFQPIDEWRGSWMALGSHAYHADHDWPKTFDIMAAGRREGPIVSFRKYNKAAVNPSLWLYTAEFPSQVVVLGRGIATESGKEFVGRLGPNETAFVLNPYTIFPRAITGWVTYRGSPLNFPAECLPNSATTLEDPDTEVYSTEIMDRLAERLARLENL